MVAVLLPDAGVVAKSPPATWDDLVLVKSKRLDRVYLLPGADFRPYTKVIIDPTEVAFRKNWQRDYNTSSPARRVSDDDAQKIMTAARTGFNDVFVKAYQEAGYQVVQTPGPDVIQLRTAILNLAVAAPDIMTAGRSTSYSSEAGQATIVIEARDSVTGAVLGRAVDHRLAGDSYGYIRGSMRTSVSNVSDFRLMFQSWAKASIAGLAELKTLSPFEPGSAQVKK
jgi:hypothetical protein